MALRFLMCNSKSTIGCDEASAGHHDWILISSEKFRLYPEPIPWTFSTVVPPLISAKKKRNYVKSTHLLSAGLHFWEACWNCSCQLSKASFPYLGSQTPNIKNTKPKSQSLLMKTFTYISKSQRNWLLQCFQVLPALIFIFLIQSKLIVKSKWI